MNSLLKLYCYPPIRTYDIKFIVKFYYKNITNLTFLFHLGRYNFLFTERCFKILVGYQYLTFLLPYWASCLAGLPREANPIFFFDHPLLWWLNRASTTPTIVIFTYYTVNFPRPWQNLPWRPLLLKLLSSVGWIV